MEEPFVKSDFYFRLCDSCGPCKKLVTFIDKTEEAFEHYFARTTTQRLLPQKTHITDDAIRNKITLAINELYNINVKHLLANSKNKSMSIYSMCVETYTYYFEGVDINVKLRNKLQALIKKYEFSRSRHILFPVLMNTEDTYLFVLLTKEDVEDIFPILKTIDLWFYINNNAGVMYSLENVVQQYSSVISESIKGEITT